MGRPTTPMRPKLHRFGLFRFRSPLLPESRLISLPPGTEMFHFPGLARTGLCIQPTVPGLFPGGFPHSETPGSQPVCGSPRLIAAYRVLHRLLTPRHPPCALNSLTLAILGITFFHLPGGRRLVHNLHQSQLVCQRTEELTAALFVSGNPPQVFRPGRLVHRTGLETRDPFLICQTSAARVVELRGIEPLTSGLQSPRSPS